MRVGIILLICILALCNSKVFGQSIFEERKVIILDAGHGGIDSGTVSEDGLQEKDVVLDIARSMVAWNKGLLESKYDIYLTRGKDTLISLNDRTKLVRFLRPDVFISLHCNHNDDSKIKGVEIYTYGQNEFSILLAQAISLGLNQKLGFKTRETKQANFQVLRETKEYCPSMLLELGYLSNADESNYLENRKKRSALAYVILTSIKLDKK